MQALVRFTLVVALSMLASCGGEPERGDVGIGEPCAENLECARGYCIANASGEEAVCTRSCGSTTDCPRGWSCSGVTDDNVLVCTRGAPTPFGIGANE